MKRRISTVTLLKRLPSGFTLPHDFDAFVAAAATTDPVRHGWFNIQWTNPTDFGLRPETRATLIPFLRLGDGGIAAFWIHAPSKPTAVPAIVHIDSEGGASISALHFTDFLARLAKHKTGIPHIDDSELPHPFPAKLATTRAPAKIPPALRSAFKRWLKENTDTHAPSASVAADLEQLRANLHALAVKMLRARLSKVYKATDDWWTLNFRATRKKEALHIEYLDYGDWKVLTTNLRAEPLFQTLLANVKHPKRSNYEILISVTGLVSVDKDRELVLEPTPQKRQLI